MDLNGKTIGIVAGPGFEDSQVIKAAQLMRQRGARVIVVGVGESEAVAVAGRQGSLLKPDVVVGNVQAVSMDALIIPGGDSNNRFTSDERVLTLILEINSMEKPIGAICDAPLVLAASGLVSGRRITAEEEIRKYLEEAGAILISQGVVVDHNLVTARG